MTERTVEISPLDGLAVVDLSSWIAGAYASRLLADGGASITRVEPVGGHRLRNWSASGADAADGALFRHLASGEHDASADELDAVLAAADVCIWSPGGRMDPDAIVAESPGGIRVLYVALTRPTQRLVTLDVGGPGGWRRGVQLPQAP